MRLNIITSSLINQDCNSRDVYGDILVGASNMWYGLWSLDTEGRDYEPKQ
jgi:hypothetical protein